MLEGSTYSSIYQNKINTLNDSSCTKKILHPCLHRCSGHRLFWRVTRIFFQAWGQSILTAVDGRLTRNKHQTRATTLQRPRKMNQHEHFFFTRTFSVSKTFKKPFLKKKQQKIPNNTKNHQQNHQKIPKEPKNTPPPKKKKNNYQKLKKNTKNHQYTMVYFGRFPKTEPSMGGKSSKSKKPEVLDLGDSDPGSAIKTWKTNSKTTGVWTNTKKNLENIIKITGLSCFSLQFVSLNLMAQGALNFWFDPRLDECVHQCGMHPSQEYLETEALCK